MALTTQTAAALVKGPPAAKDVTMRMKILHPTVIRGIGAVEPGEVYEVAEYRDQRELLDAGLATVVEPAAADEAPEKSAAEEMAEAAAAMDTAAREMDEAAQALKKEKQARKKKK